MRTGAGNLVNPHVHSKIVLVNINVMVSMRDRRGLCEIGSTYDRTSSYQHTEYVAKHSHAQSSRYGSLAITRVVTRVMALAWRQAHHYSIELTHF